MKNKFFDLKLYIEGLRRLRIMGTAFALLSMGSAVITPMSYGYTENLTEGDLIAPLIILLLASFLLVSKVFGYLNSRKRSDFYHAIPLPRKCVYFSFMAAAITWVWGILIVSLFIETSLWGFNFYPSTVLLVGVAFAVATLFIMAVTAVSRMLTGTEVSSTALFAVLFLSLRLFGTIAKFTMEMLVPIYDFERSFLHYLGFEFFLPLRVLELYDTDGIIPLIIYTLVISIAMILVGCVLYTRRRSEMAGNSAPGPMIHNLYRYAISTPLLLVSTGLLLERHFGDIYVDDDFIMAFASTLAFYFLYELITKKNVKKMFAAAKGLWVLLVIAVVFSGAMIIGRNHIINYDLSAEDIESVEIIDDNSYYLSPQAKILTLDPELAKECAARAYRDTCDELRAQGRINAHNGAYTVIKLKSGRELYCRLVNFEKASDIYRKRIAEGVEYQMTLPERNERTYVEFYSLSKNNHGYDPYYQQLLVKDDIRWDTLWSTFYREYQTLSDEEKAMVQTGTNATSSYVMVFEKCNDDKYDHTYICKAIYYIPEFMPKTLNAIYRNQ